jgi:hypothetical protein
MPSCDPPLVKADLDAYEYKTFPTLKSNAADTPKSSLAA